MSYNFAAAEYHRAMLFLSTPFTEPELKASYRCLIRQWHPDRYSSHPHLQDEATEKAKLINVAYEFLSELLEDNGGIYRSAAPNSTSTWSRADLQPQRRYEGKSYKAGFPDQSVTEIFLKSSHIVSTGYHRSTQTLYIKFSSNTIYRYFGVAEQVYEAFLNSDSHGKFAHKNIYQSYRQELC